MSLGKPGIYEAMNTAGVIGDAGQHAAALCQGPSVPLKVWEVFFLKELVL